MKKVSAKVYIYFLQLPENSSFYLDKNLKMEFETFRKEDSLSIFDIKGQLDSQIENPEEYIHKKIKLFLNLTNFSKGTSPNEFFVNSEIEGKGKTEVTGNLNVYTQGKLRLDTDDLKLIQANQLRELSEDHLLCLDFYKKACDSKDLYAKYWYLYTIALILIQGEREDIKSYFLSDSATQTTYSDWKSDKGDIPNFIFARDLFSHKDKTSHGERISKDTFLKENIDAFMKEIKGLMRDKIPPLESLPQHL